MKNIFNIMLFLYNNINSSRRSYMFYSGVTETEVTVTTGYNYGISAYVRRQSRAVLSITMDSKGNVIHWALTDSAEYYKFLEKGLKRRYMEFRRGN